MLSTEELAAVVRHAEADYPAECCGVVMAEPLTGGGAARRHVLPCRNVQDALHDRDPARFPRTSRTAYSISPEDLLEIGRRESLGWRLEVIYHSHVDAGPYFSETDRRNALMDGEPLYPDVTYVVVSVERGRVAAHRSHRWSAEVRDFVEASGGPETRQSR